MNNFRILDIMLKRLVILIYYIPVSTNKKDDNYYKS
jgi:hypothetical protein